MVSKLAADPRIDPRIKAVMGAFPEGPPATDAKDRAQLLAEQATPEAIEVETVVEPEVKGKGKSRGKAPRVRAKVVETAEAAPPAKKTRGGKAPSARDVAKSGAPKTSRKQARAPAVRRTAPRGGKG